MYKNNAKLFLNKNKRFPNLFNLICNQKILTRFNNQSTLDKFEFSEFMCAGSF